MDSRNPPDVPRKDSHFTDIAPRVFAASRYGKGKRELLWKRGGVKRPQGPVRRQKITGSKVDKFEQKPDVKMMIKTH